MYVVGWLRPNVAGDPGRHSDTKGACQLEPTQGNFIIFHALHAYVNALHRYTMHASITHSFVPNSDLCVIVGWGLASHTQTNIYCTACVRTGVHHHMQPHMHTYQGCIYNEHLYTLVHTCHQASIIHSAHISVHQTHTFY